MNLFRTNVINNIILIKLNYVQKDLKPEELNVRILTSCLHPEFRFVTLSSQSTRAGNQFRVRQETIYMLHSVCNPSTAELSQDLGHLTIDRVQIQ